MTKPFRNSTDEGNEQAIKFGPVVPEEGVNLAFVKVPPMTPKDNVVIVDTSRIVEENIAGLSERRKLYYANSMGVLEDGSGNQLVEEEFPLVTDVFVVDEDFSTLPGSEYSDNDILPFVHTSRYFHIDWAGLVLPGDEIPYKTDVIKVVDGKGRPYVDEAGKPRYKIRIVPAKQTNIQSGDQTPYRVFAYVDTDLNEELYLTYNKIELLVTGSLTNQVLGHTELLNPQPLFEYRPEESEVIDPFNRKKKYYSTKPITQKSQAMGLPTPNVNGYKVYVPRKALPDPRIFQLFHWRLACDFTQQYKVDPTRTQIIQCGVLVTTRDLQSTTPCAAPYALLNLMRSNYNAAGVLLQNPMFETTATVGNNASDKELASYWYVNIDTVTEQQLAKFDFLIWAPNTPALDFTPYLSKINYFTNTQKGTLFIDTSNYCIPSGLGVVTTPSASPNTGVSRTLTGASVTWASLPFKVAGWGGLPVISPVSQQLYYDPIATLSKGLAELGGWELPDTFNNSELETLSYLQTVATGTIAYTQGILTYPSDYRQLYGVGSAAVLNKTPNLTSATTTPLTIYKRTSNGGNIIFSTWGHLYTCSALFSNVTKTLIASNKGPQLYPTGSYSQYINSENVEGAMKLLYNALMMSVKGRILDDRDERSYSSSWSYYTPWEASWVIKAGDDVLSEVERDRHDFYLLPRDALAATPDTTPIWKRRLSIRTVKEMMDNVLKADSVLEFRSRGAARSYRVEITNPLVQTDSVLPDTSPPHAYTETFTPKFLVPVELGPHVVREEEIKGDYSVGQYTYRAYPEKPYAALVQGSYVATAEHATQQTGTWAATGTATETVTISTFIPPSTTSSTSEVSLSWWNYPYSGTRQWPIVHDLYPRFGIGFPYGVGTWQDDNYYTSNWGPGHLNWPFIGHFYRYSVGSTGEVVQFIQEALNRFMYFGFFDTGVGYLNVDGRFGGTTKTAVFNFQSTFGARYLDGIVDAETWSIIGYQILRGGNQVDGHNDDDFTRFFAWPGFYMRQQSISDGSPSVYAKRSWYSGGPSIIWDLFRISFNQAYNIHAVTLTPWLAGDTQDLMFRSIRVANSPLNLTNFNSEDSQLTYMPYRPSHGSPFRVNFGPYQGDTIIVGVGQDRGSGFGSSRFIGIDDIVAHANVTTSTTIPGRTIITQQSKTIPISASGSVSVVTNADKTINAFPNYSGTGRLTNIIWKSVTSSSTNIIASITTTGVLNFKTLIVTQNSNTDFTSGVRLPLGLTYYSMDENRRINPTPETGFISKADGLKLFCNITGAPVGFPTLPTNVGPNEYQRHYTTLTLVSLGTDANVQLSFYDINKQEFIVSAAGTPEISYIEWLTRGVGNVYVAAISTYEFDRREVIPEDSDAPTLPYRWAMPVYGLYQRGGSRITLEALPPNLGPYDVWPVAVRDGHFGRSVRVRPRSEGFLTGYLNGYQGNVARTFTAFYGIPEANMGDSSEIYGPPCADVTGESPLIIDDDMIQVRQAPILMVKEPTTNSSSADPVRPVFTVYKRTTPISSWVPLGWHNIRDYNVSTGEIQLVTPLLSDDANLVKVNYVTERRHYHFKKYGSTLLNLNPYPGQSRELVNVGIYIYIVPEYVKDDGDIVLSPSVQPKTLRFSTSNSIFDPLRPDYDPFAILLGVVYTSTALDVNKLALLDTRRRGGGAEDGQTSEEVIRLVQEASSYWDLGYGTGSSYQKGGFIIIRLPAELKASFTETEITEIIERNITAGVRYKLEDLHGGSWS